MLIAPVWLLGCNVLCLPAFEPLFWGLVALFLVLGVVLLQWHYLMDIVGGVAVALLGIWLASRTIGAKPVVPSLGPG